MAVTGPPPPIDTTITQSVTNGIITPTYTYGTIPDTFTYDNTLTVGPQGPLGATGGTGGYYTSIPSITISDNAYSHHWGNVFQAPLEVTGDIKFGNGKSLIETLNKIEERLAILHTNTELEKKWDKLRELGEQYRALEKDILEKEKIVEILKR